MTRGSLEGGCGFFNEIRGSGWGLWLLSDTWGSGRVVVFERDMGLWRGSGSEMGRRSQELGCRSPEDRIGKMERNDGCEAKSCSVGGVCCSFSTRTNGREGERKKGNVERE